MRQCIENSLDAHGICLQTVTYCLEQGGKHAEIFHIKRLLDCAEMTQVCADFILRNSEDFARVCEVTEYLCSQAAADCARFGADVQMQACANACRICAGSCHVLIKPMAA